MKCLLCILLYFSLLSLQQIYFMKSCKTIELLIKQKINISSKMPHEYIHTDDSLHQQESTRCSSLQLALQMWFPISPYFFGGFNKLFPVAPTTCQNALGSLSTVRQTFIIVGGEINFAQFFNFISSLCNSTECNLNNKLNKYPNWMYLYSVMKINNVNVFMRSLLIHIYPRSNLDFSRNKRELLRTLYSKLVHIEGEKSRL